MALTHVNPLDLITDTWANSVADAVNANQTAVAATPWVAPTLLGTWVNFAGLYQPAQYRKLGEGVELRGVVKGGALAANIFVLPVGFRPLASIQFPCVSGGAFGYITVLVDGGVQASVGSTTSFDMSPVRFSTIA